MAELYDQNKIYANRPTASSQAPQSADAELEAMLAELPPEERETARAKITAPPTGEDIYKVMQERNANGEVFNMNLDQYRQYKAYIKTKEVDVLDAMGTAAEGVFNEIMAAAGSIYDKPLESTAKLTPSLIEAFAQGTRNLYGMAAQSQDPNSVFFRVKNAITANGDDEEAEFQQFMDAQAFNVQSMKLATGQETWIMDKDLINPEVTQVMSYIADPTLFVPFGGIAAKGARMIGMGEGLARASARAAQIQRKVLGGAIKWGVGAPIEFLGTATRNTIDYGLERAGAAFEVATGMPAAEARTTAQMYGWYTASAALEGRNVPFPVFGDVAGAMVGSTTARGIGESLTMVGEQMQKQQQFGRGILSYAGQALRDANKSGVPLSKHAKALLNVLDKADPLFVYSADISKGAAEGMAIGAGLGYLSAGEEGAASGAGAGMVLGAAGAGMGAVVADVGKGRLYDRIAVQRQMVIEGLRQIDPDKAAAFEALVKTAELNGNRDVIAQIDGIITGIDVMAPDARVVVRDADAHIEWLRSQKIDPDTGRLMEPLALFPEFGTDRKSRAKALSFLSMLGNRFDGDHKLLIKELQGLPQDHSLRKQFMRLSEEQKKSVFDAIDKAATPEFKEKFGGKNGYEFYGDLNYAEANVARVNAMFDAGNKTQANEMIRQFIKDETGKDGKLSARGELLKQKLATEGYFDKDGNMRPSRLKDVEMTAKEFKNAKGFVFRRDSTGQVELHINLKEFGKETLPHELFHAVMLDSVLKPDFIDRLSQNLLGKFDADGKRIENASVDIKQVRQFFQRYIDALHGKNSQDAVNETARLEAAMKEYESRGTTNKIALDTKNTLEGLLEEFGAYYFGAFINDKPVDFLFRGGELGAMREIMGNAKQGFLDFWRSKIKGMNPDFNFDPATNQFIFQAFEKEGVRTKNKSLDLLMRDFVRATAMANKQGGFDVSRLSPAARETFIKNNGIRGLSMTRDANGNLVRSPQRKVIQEQMRVGKEIYKILSGLDPKFRQGLITDGEGNLSGRLSPEAMEAIVQSGHIDRAWVDKIQQAYNILDGKGGNVIHFGYLGRTAQIGDYAWPRLVGSDVPFKNRQAVLLGVDFKVGKDGKMYSLFHTLDKAVIDGRADVLWSDSAVRTLWNGDRGAMEADFFRYLANASKAAGDSSRVESAVLLEDGTGAGARRRDVLHQMLGIVKAEGDMYINKPIAEIPYGIRHSVTTFNVDGIANMRVGTDRWNVVPENAFKDLSRNFQPSEMAREDTPNGAIIKHPLGYKFAEKNGKIRAFDKNGNSIGVFDGIEQAAEAAKKYEGKLQVEREQFTEEVRQEQDKKMARFQPIEDATRRQALQPDGDLFSTEEVKAFTQGTRVIKQTQQEFVAQYVQEMLKPENKAKLTELIEQSFDRFRELREIEKQLNSEMEQLTWDSKSNQEQLKIFEDRLVEYGRELAKKTANQNELSDKKIIEYFVKHTQKQQELIKRSGEIIAELEAQGITDRSSEYYKTKMAYESYEQGKLSPEVAAVFLESQMQKVYNDQYATGVPVTFVANHGTPNYELIATKMFDVTRLGENTGSASAKRATFFSGSDKTAINYVGVPLEPNWINHPDYAWYFDWDRIKKTIERNYSNADLVTQNTEALFNEVKSRLQHHDTSKGAKNEIEKILASLEVRMKAKEILNISTDWLYRLSNHMVDVGTTFGGSEIYWQEAGRPPHLMRQLVKMNNPFVFEYRRADFRDVTFNEVIMKATEAGHDGVIFKNARDGGGTDIIYALISNTPNEAIKVFDTAHDTNAVNRGLDENGNKIMNGRELGLMHQPTEGAEGGRVYDQNSNEFKFNFIGKQAEENQDLIQGKNLEFVKRKDGSYRITLTDNTKQGETAKIGHITATLDMSVAGEGAAEISSNINQKYRGKKLSNILYSEMAERLRSMGIKYVDGTIVNKDGIPVQVRNTVIGQTYYKGSNKPAFREDTAKKVQAVQSVYPSKGIGVYNELDPKARYQPTEGEKAPINWVKDGFNKEGYNAEVVWMTPERFLKLAAPLGDRANDESSRARIEQIKKTLQTKGGDMDMPYFSMKRNKSGELQVSGHEGRHRAIAIQELYGDKKIPVYLTMDEMMKMQNRGDMDFGVPESERKKGTVSKEFKALEDAPFLNELGTGRFQPAEYQGGDDYYKPRSNPFERKDEQGFLIREPYIRKPARTGSGEKFEMNPDNVMWEDIGHFKRLSEKETGLSVDKLYRWENDDVGLWAFNTNTDAVVTKNKINPRELGFRYTHNEWFDEPFWSNNYTTIWGRYEKPIYDNGGNLVRRGKISMTGQYRGSIKDMAHAKKIKNDIAKKVKVSAEDIDAYIFDASEPIKQSMGFSPKDQLPIKFQPKEGDEGIVPDVDFDAIIRADKEKQKNAYRGKQYTPEQMTFSFIGRYASERPEFIKGLELMYSGTGTSRSLVLSDSDTGKRIGSISLSVDSESANRHAYIQMSDVVKQGRGYGTLLYSELAERLRSEGYTSINGRVVDNLGRPLKIRASVIDNVNRDLGKSVSNVVGERVESPLYPEARYQPTEGGRKYNKSEMDNQFIGKQAADRRDLIDGIRLAYRPWDKADGKNEGRKKIILTRSSDGAEIGRIDFDYDHLTKYGLKNRGFGENENGGIVVDGINVKVREQFQGKGYQHILYSEMFERARALGAIGFSQSIENKKGIPLKSVNRVIGEANNFIASLTESDPQRPTQENFDRLMATAPSPTGDWVSNEPSVQNWGKLDPKARYQPTDGANAPVNKENRRSIIRSIESNLKSLRAFEEGKKRPKDRTQNYITIDNINPDLIRGEAVVMHSPDNAGIEPVKIGRFTVEQKGGMRYPIEEPTEGWASNKTGLSKDINELGDDNASKGKGWWSPLALIKGLPEKNRGTHSGFQIFIRNIQNWVDNKVLTEGSAKRIIKSGFPDADVSLPLDAMADRLITLSESNEGKYSITARREGIDEAVTKALWTEIGGKQGGASKLAPYVEGFNPEGITTSKDFRGKLLNSIYELAADPITRHAKVGDVYAYVIFRSKTQEPESGIHPSYRYSVAPEKSGQPVQLDILSTPMPARDAFRYKIVAGMDVPLKDATDESFKASTGQQNIATARGRFQPSEGFTNFQTERTPTGVLLKNAAGYVISRVGSKYRVYNPYKAVIGVFDSEEQAKKRIYKEEPRR